MRCRVYVLAFAATVAFVSSGWAQAPPDPQEIRNQIDALQRQLHQAEQQEPTSTRVSQIGSSKRPIVREPERIVRIYDLSDLFTIAPPYPARYTASLMGNDEFVFQNPMLAQTQSTSGMGGGGMGGMGGSGGGFYSVPGAPGSAAARAPLHVALNNSPAGGGEAVESRTSITELISAITSTIAPESWKAAGGAGTISRIGNTLLISCESQTHDQIDELLALFRKKWGTLRTVSMRADWRWLTDAQLALLLPGDGVQPLAGRRVFGVVEDAAWQKLNDAKVDPAAPGDYRAVLTCYNGQTVSNVTDAQSLAVTQLEPVILNEPDEDPKNHRVAYRPIMSVLHQGAVLQATPLVNTSGNFVVVDMHSRVTKLAKTETPPPADKPAGAPAAHDAPLTVDRPEVLSSNLSTTLRLPIDKTMLIGGMTLQSEPTPGAPNLYLFLRVSMQELRDDIPLAGAAAGENGAKKPGGGDSGKPKADGGKGDAPKSEPKAKAEN